MSTEPQRPTLFTDPAAQARGAQLGKLRKPALVQMLRSGIRTPDGGVRTVTGRVDAWRKDELINFILEAEFPHLPWSPHQTPPAATQPAATVPAQATAEPRHPAAPAPPSGPADPTRGRMPPDPHRGLRHMSPADMSANIRWGLELGSPDAVREWFELCREVAVRAGVALPTEPVAVVRYSRWKAHPTPARRCLACECPWLAHYDGGCVGCYTCPAYRPGPAPIT
ncbi:hypothetical protein [Krasilnikovia sp. MM14-A1259]|uniref:hypothetical protein n=1 Tax=Krasilnikovia sp. MM14-A1259 TaxID=3373539 RepID=UPI0037FFD476